MLKICGYEVEVLVTDKFRLDGGAMFGAVPKSLWAKCISADERNRIQLACRVLLLKSLDRFVLVDLGVGRKWDEKKRDIFAIEHLIKKPIHEYIEGVTDIIVTHLHFDHAGGISYLDALGNSELSFPEARVYLSEVHWQHALNPGVRERASYLSENIEPLKCSKLQFVSDGLEILPGIKVFNANGHTHGLLWVLVGDGPGALAFPSDLIPTAHHLSIPYVMGYDLCAETSMKEKEAFLLRAVRDKWIVVFEHDASIAAVTVTNNKRGQFVVDREVNI